MVGLLRESHSRLFVKLLALAELFDRLKRFLSFDIQVSPVLYHLPHSYKYLVVILELAVRLIRTGVFVGAVLVCAEHFRKRRTLAKSWVRLLL